MQLHTITNKDESPIILLQDYPSTEQIFKDFRSNRLSIGSNTSSFSAR